MLLVHNVILEENGNKCKYAINLDNQNLLWRISWMSVLFNVNIGKKHVQSCYAISDRRKYSQIVVFEYKRVFEMIIQVSFHAYTSCMLTYGNRYVIIDFPHFYDVLFTVNGVFGYSPHPFLLQILQSCLAEFTFSVYKQEIVQLATVRNKRLVSCCPHVMKESMLAGYTALINLIQGLSRSHLMSVFLHSLV